MDSKYTLFQQTTPRCHFFVRTFLNEEFIDSLNGALACLRDPVVCDALERHFPNAGSIGENLACCVSVECTAKEVSTLVDLATRNSAFTPTVVFEDTYDPLPPPESRAELNRLVLRPLGLALANLPSKKRDRIAHLIRLVLRFSFSGLFEETVCNSAPLSSLAPLSTSFRSVVLHYRTTLGEKHAAVVWVPETEENRPFLRNLDRAIEWIQTPKIVQAMASGAHLWNSIQHIDLGSIPVSFTDTDVFSQISFGPDENGRKQLIHLEGRFRASCPEALKCLVLERVLDPIREFLNSDNEDTATVEEEDLLASAYLVWNFGECVGGNQNPKGMFESMRTHPNKKRRCE